MFSIWRANPPQWFAQPSAATGFIHTGKVANTPPFPDGHRMTARVGPASSPPTAASSMREYQQPDIVGIPRSRIPAADPCHVSFRQVSIDRRDTDFNDYNLAPISRQQDILARDFADGLPMPDLSQLYLEDGPQ